MQNFDGLPIDSIRNHINTAKRVDLQALYKLCGIKGANKKNEVLRETLIQMYEDRHRAREEEEVEGDTGSTAGEMSVDTDDGSTEPVDSGSSEAVPSSPKSEETQPNLERSAIDMRPSKLGASFSPQRTPFPSPERDLPSATLTDFDLLEDLQDQVSGLRRDLETSRRKTVVPGTPSIRLTNPSDDEHGSPTCRNAGASNTPPAEMDKTSGEKATIDTSNDSVQTPNVVSKTFAFFSQGWGYKPSLSPTPSKIPLPDSPLGCFDECSANSAPETPIAGNKALQCPTPVTPVTSTGAATLAVLGVRTVPNSNTHTACAKKETLPRRLSLVSNSASCPAKPLVSPVDSRTSSSSSLSFSREGTHDKLSSSVTFTSTENEPTTPMEQEYGIAQLAAMTPFIKGRLQYPITLPRAGAGVRAGARAGQTAHLGNKSISDTPSRATSIGGARTCINVKRVAGLERGMASLNLLDQSPSPCKGNFLRLTPEVEHV